MRRRDLDQLHRLADKMRHTLQRSGAYESRGAARFLAKAVDDALKQIDACVTDLIAMHEGRAEDADGDQG